MNIGKIRSARTAFMAATLICGLQASATTSPGSAAAHHRRPQEARIAATAPPYHGDLVAFDNPTVAGVRLAGTLTLPPGDGPFPGIVLISGSGPNGRDEEVAHHKLALVLADALTRDGYAVLRYDKRGVAKSSGNYDAATTLDSASDAAAAVAYMRSRSDIAQTKVGLVGHSEGGTVAAMVAAKDPSLAFIVMMAGYSIPGKVLVAEQTRRIAVVEGEPPATAAREYALNRRLYDAIAASTDQHDAEAGVRKVLAGANPKPGKDQVELSILFTQLPSMRFVLAFDPAESLGDVQVPVLALYGSRDLIVPADLNIPVLRDNLKRDKDVTVEELPGLNHLFQHATTGSPREFSRIEETLAPEVPVVISNWIRQHISSKEAPPG